MIKLRRNTSEHKTVSIAVARWTIISFFCVAILSCGGDLSLGGGDGQSAEPEEVPGCLVDWDFWSIYYFTVTCEDITHLDEIKNTQLIKTLRITNNRTAQSLNLAGYRRLENLLIEGENFTNIDLSNLSIAVYLDIKAERLVDLKLPHKLMELKLRNTPRLTQLDVSHTRIERVVLTGEINFDTSELFSKSELWWLSLSDSSRIELDVSTSTIRQVRLDKTNIQILRLPNNSSAGILDVREHGANSLKIVGGTNYKRLVIEKGELLTLDMPDLESILALVLIDLPLSLLDLSHSPDLKIINIRGAPIRKLNLPELTNLTEMIIEGDQMSCDNLIDIRNQFDSSDKVYVYLERIEDC